jgi:hypothetical protein
MSSYILSRGSSSKRGTVLGWRGGVPQIFLANYFLGKSRGFCIFVLSHIFIYKLFKKISYQLIHYEM